MYILRKAGHNISRSFARYVLAFLRNIWREKVLLIIAASLAAVGLHFYWKYPIQTYGLPSHKSQLNRFKPVAEGPYTEKLYPRYADDLLVEWQPAPKVPINASEPGYLGKRTDLPPSKTLMGNFLFEVFQLNVLASDMVPLNRTLKDFRLPQCLNKTYPRKLPTTTVIMVFSDESWSTLIRTVWSIYARSPRALIKEIILVDDYSDLPHLGKRLDDYVRQIPTKTRVIRLRQRSGATVARQIAIQLVKTPTVTFIDAHCECTDGWLEPLLANVLENRRAVVTPMIDFIYPDLLQQDSMGQDFYGTFNWQLFFIWDAIANRERKRVNGDKTQNVRTPEFAGGIYSMDTEYFYDLGGYDDGMTFYAAENIEMSLRVWMCGGSIETVPCSRVAHIQRNKKTYSIPGGLYMSMLKNTIRVADAWLDDYRKMYYAVQPEALSLRTDVSDRLDIRRRLNCKPFKWYIENIFPESVYARKYIDIGAIESSANLGSCLTADIYAINPVNVTECHFGSGSSQSFILTERGEIVASHWCVAVDVVDKPASYQRCYNHYSDNAVPNQKFVYDKTTNQFIHNGTNCLTLEPDNKVMLRSCDETEAQKWIIHSYIPPDELLQ